VQTSADIRSGALSLALERPASPWMLALIALATTAFFIGGQLMNFPVLILALLPVGAGLMLFLNRSSAVSMYAFLCTSFGLALRPVTMAGTDPIDLLAGAILGMITLGVVIKVLYVAREPVTYSVPQLLGALYLVWGLFTGIGGILWWNNTWNDWLREFLLQSPLFLIPVLYVRTLRSDSEGEHRFHKFLFGMALVLMLATVIKYGYTVSTSIYAYQIGRASIDVSASIIVLLTFLAFTLHNVPLIKMRYRILISCFCIATLVLSGYRTFWVCAAIGFVLLFLLAPPKQWSRSVRYLVPLTVLLLTVGVTLYYTVPIFKIFVMMTFNRLLSTTELGTDPSLVNRYIETDIIKTYIAASPITGYGFGAKFQLFDWLLGYTYDFGFSHNGYYFVMFKTGIVGFVMIYSAFAWFVVRAYRIARDVTESPRVRALASVAFGYLVIIAIANTTLNTFGERNGMIWVGIFWAYILSRDIAKRLRERDQFVTPAALAIGNE
jgi:O-antigen ligase